jgi:uncharacterized protein YcaQ
MTDPGPEVISRPLARRIALAAQGFARPRPPSGQVTARDVRRVLETVGLVQIDSVNVLARSQYLPFFSRLGPYDPALLDALRDRPPRRVLEYWAHEASLVPVALWPSFQFRRDRAATEAWGGMQSVARQHPDVVAAVLAEVATRGPVTARDLEALIAHDHDRARVEWGWNWSVVKRALEHLFWAGEVTSAGRTSQFERRYAVPHRALSPADRWVVTERIPEAEQFLTLIELGARAHGIGTEQCFRDYARLRPEQARPALATLVDRGVLREVRVEGWRRTAYVHRDARRPRRVSARALLSPFDSLIWTRDRVRALFEFDYRLEIYTPAAKRVHGYYVLPFLLGDELVGRVDLKADRAAGVLRVQRLTWEPGRGGAGDRAELDAELDLMARWLSLAPPADSR